MLTIYGIPNCDTMRKARVWLDARGIAYRFHDYKKEGIEASRLAGWADELGWENLLNRSGTTFRALPDAEKQGLSREGALELMQRQPSMIRRPVLDLGPRRIVGFKPEVYAAAFPLSGGG